MHQSNDLLAECLRTFAKKYTKAYRKYSFRVLSITQWKIWNTAFKYDIVIGLIILMD